MPIDIELVIKLKLPMMKIVGLFFGANEIFIKLPLCNSKFYVVRITNLQLVLRNFIKGLFLQQRKNLDTPETLGQFKVLNFTQLMTFSRHSWLKNVYVGQLGEYLEFVHG
ncbi:11836_t:CDS:2, partial [Funneliformis mosseae]